MTGMHEAAIVKKIISALASLLLLIPSCSPKQATYKVDDGNISVLFSPRAGCAQRVSSELAKAKNTAVVAMYSLTSRPITQALVDAKARGVDVRICIDGTKPDEKYSKESYLKDKGIPVKLIKGNGLMHNKFCVIDGDITITGSFNWTARAESENDENLLVIRSQDIAKRYKDKFEELWRR